MADMVTKQELEEAKIDVKHAGEAVNTKKVITPRYGAPFKSLPLVAAEAQAKADEVVAQGFYRGYTTEALLLAAKPAVAEMRARADNTRKIFRWNRTSAEGVTPITGNWVDTGLSDKDLAAADATTKANAAQANAIAAAATDATTKANAAQANAKTYADTTKLDLSKITIGYLGGNKIGPKTPRYTNLGITGNGSDISTSSYFDSVVLQVKEGDDLYIENSANTFVSAYGARLAFFAEDPNLNRTQTAITHTATDIITPVNHWRITVPVGAKYLMLNTRSVVVGTTVNLDWSVHEGAYDPSFTSGDETVTSIQEVDVGNYAKLIADKAELNAKTYADEVVEEGKSDIVSTLQDGLGLANFVGAGIIPVITDESNKILLGYNPVKQEFVGNLLDRLAISSSLNLDGLYNFIGSGVIPFFTDSNNTIIMGYDPASEKIVGNFDSAAIKSDLFFDHGQYIAAINHLMTYGQSLSTGSMSLPLLSLSQPNQNVKFVGGIRGNTEFESTVPLTEDGRRDQSAATNGETPVSGAANYAVMSAYRDNGVSADKHVVLGSASGIGGKRLESLAKGTLQYDEHLLAHIRGGAALNPDYAYQATMWLQGESDELTDYATYKNMFYKLITDIATDVRKISKQTFDPAFITYQTSAYTTTTATPAKVQLEAIKDGKAFLSCPVYRLNVLDDGLHLTNASSKLMGCYFGRVYKQLVVDKRKPDWLEPLSASINDKVIRVKFKAPKLPLVFDTTSMDGGQITDYGFAITNAANVKQTISSVVIEGDSILITLANTPSEPLKVRYALDYASLFIGNSVKGGRGNLRDSTDDMVTIDEVTYQMFHVAPHFEMNIKTLEV